MAAEVVTAVRRVRGCFHCRPDFGEMRSPSTQISSVLWLCDATQVLTSGRFNITKSQSIGGGDKSIPGRSQLGVI
jgi:hypothetical protein